MEAKVIIHLLVDGDSEFMGKKSKRIACDRGQELLKGELQNRPKYMTGFPGACTCIDCLEAIDFDLGDSDTPTRARAAQEAPIE